MGLRSAIRSFITELRNPQETRDNPFLGMMNIGTSLPKSKTWNTDDAVREGYEQHITVFRCVRKIAIAMSEVDWEVVNSEGEAVEGDAANLIANPSDQYSWNKTMQYISGYKSLAGDSFLLYNEFGNQRELWPLYPGYIQIKETDDGMIEGYKYGTGDDSKDYGPDEVIHFQFINYRPQWEGVPPLKPAGRIVDTDNKAIDWNKGTLERGGRPSGALSADHELTKRQKKQLEEQRDKMQNVKDDAAHIPIFGADMDYVQFSQTAEELSFIDSREMNKSDIADAYGVPAELLNFKDATYENRRRAKVDFWTETVIPRLEEIKAELNLQLADKFDNNIEFDFNLAGTPAMIGSRVERAEEAQKYWDMGVPFEEINDKLDLGFDPDNVPESDTGYVGSTKLPAGSAEDSNRSGSTLETRAVNLETEEQKTQYWRAIDRKKRGYEGTVASKINDIFEEEREAVIDAYEKGLSVGTVIEQQQQDWLTLLMSSKKGIVEVFGEDLIDQLEGERGGSGIETREVDPFPPRVKAQVEEQTGQSVERILSTTREDIEGLIASGKADGLTKSVIVDKITEEYERYKDHRSSFIARTEVHSAAEMGKHSAARQSNVVKKKKWITSRDARVRESHSNIDGQTRLMKETYSNGLKYPGDLSGPVDEVINCRCTQQFITKRQ